jgi:hypothetical protein
LMRRGGTSANARWLAAPRDSQQPAAKRGPSWSSRDSRRVQWRMQNRTNSKREALRLEIRRDLLLVQEPRKPCAR